MRKTRPENGRFHNQYFREVFRLLSRSSWKHITSFMPRSTTDTVGYISSSNEFRGWTLTTRTRSRTIANTSSKLTDYRSLIRPSRINEAQSCRSTPTVNEIAIILHDWTVSILARSRHACLARSQPIVRNDVVHRVSRCFILKRSNKYWIATLRPSIYQ